MIYNKTATTIEDQIAKLRERGLQIIDIGQARHFLSNISYYRLEGYWWPMQADKTTHLFKPNSRFEDVIALYNFDRELRLLIFDVIERIEIGFRTKVIYHLSHEIGPWWFEDESNFKSGPAHTQSLIHIDRDLNQSKDTFITQHYTKYHKDRRRPPSWKTFEVVSFGILSKLYSNLQSSINAKDTIAKELNLVNHTFLPSWLQTIAQIRNICAHHGRLWNKNLPGRPKLLSKPPAPWLKDVPNVSQHQMLYIHICCMKYLLDVISPGHHFTPKLSELFNKFPSVDLKALGFPVNWQEEPLWITQNQK